MSSLTLQTRLAPAPECAYQRVGTQAIAIVPSRRRQHFFENEVASDILQGIEDRRTLREIRDRLLADYDAPAETVEKDLLALCQRLVDEGVAEVVRAPDS